jgi:hypothetical protein
MDFRHDSINCLFVQIIVAIGSLYFLFCLDTKKKQKKFKAAKK